MLIFSVRTVFVYQGFSCLLCSQIFAQLAAQRQAHADADTGDRGDVLRAETHAAGVAGSIQTLDGLVIVVQHLLVVGGHKAAGGHQCKAQAGGGDVSVEGSLCHSMRAMFGSRSFSISLLPPKPPPANKNLIFIPLENDTIPAWAVWNVENRSPSLQLLAQELHLS